MNYDMSSYFEDPEFKEALAKYEGMVENHTPAYFEADELIDIAEYYTLKGRHKDADKAIDLTLQLHPENTDALVFRIRSLMLQNKKEEAKVVAQLIANSTDRECRFLQADMLMEEDRIEEAEEIFKQLVMDEEYEVDTLLDIIQDYTNANQEEYAGQWVDCLFAHSDMQTLPKTNQRLRDVLCDYYSTFNKPDLAIPYLNMTLNEYPYSIEHWNELGKCHLQQCQYEEANEALDFALAIDDENTDSLTLKAFGYHQAGNLKESCDYYLRLANVSKNKTKAYLALAQIYLEMRDHASAISYIEKLINRKSGLTDYELAELYSDTALCHAYLGHTENGYKYINQALELNEHDAEIRIAAERFFTIEAQKSDISEEEQENNLRNAEHQFTRALEFTPKEERFDVLFKIGSLYFDEHNFEYANQYFELINKEFPEDADATYFFLAYGYYHQQESASFMHYLAKIRKEIPDMYATMGTGDTILMTDTYFNEALRAIKEDVSTGKINLNKYL